MLRFLSSERVRSSYFDGFQFEPYILDFLGFSCGRFQESSGNLVGDRLGQLNQHQIISFSRFCLICAIPNRIPGAFTEPSARKPVKIKNIWFVLKPIEIWTSNSFGAQRTKHLKLTYFQFKTHQFNHMNEKPAPPSWEQRAAACVLLYYICMFFH